MFSTIEEKKFKDKWPWLNIFTCRESKKKKKTASQSSIVPMDDETTTQPMSFLPRLTKNLVFIIIWKHALNVTSFILTIALAWNQKLRKKASVALLNLQDQQGMILICTNFLLKFSITKIWICRRSQSIELAAKKKSKQGTTKSAGSARYYYWFLLVLTQIVNWNSHLVADLLRCQFCTQWEHASYQMHGNSHKNGLWAYLILS